MQVVRWPEKTLPDETGLRRQLQQRGLAPYSWSNRPGDTYAVHSHGYQKVLYCIRGSIRFVLPDEVPIEQNVDLSPGDCLLLPPGVRHSAIVGPEGVTCLEASVAASS